MAVLQKLPVLIVDDDVDLRETLSDLFQAKGFVDIKTAVDGADGLQKLATLASPHVVLVDLMMPNLNGWQFLAKIKPNPDLSKHRFAFMSASHPEKSDIDGYLFFPKPLHFSSLLAFMSKEA
jgi:CheY-like chemotaxis protein